MNENDRPSNEVASEAKPSLRERIAALRGTISRPAWVAIGALTLLCAGLSVGLVAATADDGAADRGQSMSHGMPPGFEAHGPEGLGAPPDGMMPPPGMHGDPPGMPPQFGEPPRAEGEGNAPRQDR